MKVKIKILKKGDSVLNVFSYESNVAISVKRKKGDVDIVLIKTNKDNIPEITDTWVISEGNGEIEVNSKNLKISTF